MIKVAIVILNWNGEAYLKKFLPGVVEKSKGRGVKVIVADNNSSDGSLDYLRKNHSNVGIVELDKNYGFSGGYFHALKQIEAEYFVLLNSDVEVAEGWLNPMLDLMEADKSIGACQPKLLDYKDEKMFEYAGAAGGYIDKYGFPFCRGRIFDTVEADVEQYNDAVEIFWASGACFMVRAAVYFEVGELDSDFFAHMEEIDLCWRIHNHNYKVVYVPDSKVYHVGGGTLPQKNPFKVYLNFRNSLLMLYKNLPNDGKRFKTLFTRLFLDGVAAIKYLTTFSVASAYAIFKAHIFYYRYVLKQRTRRERKQLKNHSGVYQKSIVLQYFYKKKKYFPELEFNVKAYSLNHIPND